METQIESAKIEQIEQRLRAIENQLPMLAAIADAVTRIADHLAPSPANIVGSKYIADRLNCTTTWVSRMATTGEIPRRCIVPGTGKGRLWKYYRKQVDEWLDNRLPNGST
jgi:hypothetical protein